MGGSDGGGGAMVDGATMDTSHPMNDGGPYAEVAAADAATEAAAAVPVMDSAMDLAMDSAGDLAMNSAIDGPTLSDAPEPTDGTTVMADAADVNPATDLRDVGLDHAVAVDQSGPSSQWAACFARSDFRTCEAYCASIAQTCAAAACGTLTYQVWDSAGGCVANMTPRGSSSDGCTVQVVSLGSKTTVRCCCQP
jgi:hypothetical protein